MRSILLLIFISVSAAFAGSMNVGTLTLTDASAQEYSKRALQESSLQGYWRLGEASGNFADSSSAGNTATVSDVTYGATSLVGSYAANTAATFDGTNDKAVLSSSSLFNWERTQSFSVEFLFKPNFPRSGASEKSPIFSKLESSGNTRGFEIAVEYNSSGNRTFVRGTVSNTLASNRAESRNSTLDLVNDQIFHVVVTYDGTSSPFSFDYWINGIQEAETNLGSGLNATILSSVAPSIGGRADDGMFGVGTIDEVSVYNAVLTPAKILDHYSDSLLGAYSQMPSLTNPKIIFDADINTDCDDAGALAILHAMQKLGECEIIACGTSVSNPDTVNAIDAINTWYGRGSIPIGRWTGATLQATGDAWVTDLKDDFPNDIGDGSLAPSATDVYRQALADADDGSVVIVQVGFSTNIQALMDSPADGISSMTGAELIEAKVARLVIMGGKYNRAGGTASFNFATHPSSASDVVANWPGTICFIGSENGDATLSGNTLDNNTPVDNPVRYAYEGNGSVNGRNSWDPLTALYAVRGASPGGVPLYQEIPGTNSVNASNGTNTWTPSRTGPHRRLCQVRTFGDMQTLLNGLMDAAP